MTAMPWSSYWVAVLTGRMGDVIWGPVVTHLTVLAPVLYLACALVKALQVSDPPSYIVSYLESDAGVCDSDVKV